MQTARMPYKLPAGFWPCCEPAVVSRRSYASIQLVESTLGPVIGGRERRLPKTVDGRPWRRSGAELVKDGKWIIAATAGRAAWRSIGYRPGEAPWSRSRNGGLHAEESADRKWLYYSKNADSPSSVWRVPRDGGEETLAIDGFELFDELRNYPRKESISSPVSAGSDGRAAIEFYDFSTGKTKSAGGYRKVVFLWPRVVTRRPMVWFTRWWIMFPAI